MSRRFDLEDNAVTYRNRIFQSKELYLQAVGSTENMSDGTPEGFHLRWDFVNELRGKHLPKGTATSFTNGFNKANDYVRVLRSSYQETFPTVVNFDFDKPYNVDNDEAIWAFTNLNTDRTVYLTFENKTAYKAVTGIDPLTNPKAFITSYGAHPIYVNVEGEYFFATSLLVDKDALNPVVKTESITRFEANTSDTPFTESDEFISCRHQFGNENSGLDVLKDGTTYTDKSLLVQTIVNNERNWLTQEDTGGLLLEQGKKYANLLVNGDFENSTLGFESQYTLSDDTGYGNYNIVSDPSIITTAWNGSPRSGKQFFIADSAINPSLIVLRQAGINVIENKHYEFSGYITNLAAHNPSIIEVKFIDNSGNFETQTFQSDLGQGNWSHFSFNWKAENTTTVTIEIRSINTATSGNDFGLDNLFFGLKKEQPVKVAKVFSENMSSFRFQVDEGTEIQEIQLETYKDYYYGAVNNQNLTFVENLYLTNNTSLALQRLNNTNGTEVDKLFDITNWKRFQDDVKVNIANYTEKWNNDDPSKPDIKSIVDQYITLSTDRTKNNPLGAIDAYQPEDESGTATINTIDILNTIATDYHIARMLGLGLINNPVADENTPYIYFVEYMIDAKLSYLAEGRYFHTYMTLPITKSEHKPCIKVDLNHDPVYGIYKDDGSHELSTLTDAHGYTPIGTSRFVNLFQEVDPNADPVEDFTGQLFFTHTKLFCSNTYTSPILFGLKYKKQGENTWRNPELMHNKEGWYNPDSEIPEVAPSPLNWEDELAPIFLHNEKEEGIHEYAAYGINWFSRASQLGTDAVTDETEFTFPNYLLAPSNFRAQLIQPEDLNQLIFTTAAEQAMLDGITSQDKTLVRASYNYHFVHDLAYQRYLSTVTPVKRNFGESVELFFRTQAPQIIQGAIKSVDNSNETLSVVRTRSYILVSQGNTVVNPNDVAVPISHFVGGSLVIDEHQYPILEVVQGPTGEGPIFTIPKSKESIVTPKEDGSYTTYDVLQGPFESTNATKLIYPAEDNPFMALENTGEETHWTDAQTGGIILPESDNQNAASLKIKIGPATQDCVSDDYANPYTGIWYLNGYEETWINERQEETTQRLRGFWDTATITPVTEATQPGVYKIEFDHLILANHAQFDTHQVNWFLGNIRIEKPGTPGVNFVNEKIPFEVISTGNIGSTTEKLILYVIDSSPVLNEQGEIETGNDRIKLGGDVKVNYYPGYKVYLRNIDSTIFKGTTILNGFVNHEKRTYMGARTIDTAEIKAGNPLRYQSLISTPATILAQEIILPLVPEKPSGGPYATMPDFYGKATYTFTNTFKHEPFAIVFMRANEDMILDALYEKTIAIEVKAALKAKKEENGDPFFVDRWKNLLSFNYDYTNADPNLDHSNENGNFRTFEGYKFPNPSKSIQVSEYDAVTDKYVLVTKSVFGTYSNLNEIKDKIKEAVCSAFLPLTEQPILYQYINRKTPVNKKQNLRTISGEYLKPTDADFDMAPMVIKTGKPNWEIQFTDFTLDGASNEVYFYCAREIGNTMMMGDFSEVTLPVRLVNSFPAEEPKITKTTVQLQDPIEELSPAVKFEFAGYHENQHIRKIRVYRANKQVDAMNLRSMKMVKEVVLDETQLAADLVQVTDDFTNEMVPFGDTLYYRLVALREVEYEQKVSGQNELQVVTEYAFSKPSKLVLTSVVDTVNPIAPTVSVICNEDITTNPEELTNVRLTWDATAYNATYYVYKMNSSGNWVKIHEIKTNDLHISTELVDTTLETSTLSKRDSEDETMTIYHRFKVDVINSSGLLNLEENPVII